MNKVTRAVLLVSCCLLAFVAYQERAQLTSKADLALLEEKYIYSAYNPSNPQRYTIEDDELYTLAGYRYVRGALPTSINKEHQPLTKYLFGLGVLVVGNASIVEFFLSVSLLVVVYYTGLRLTKNPLVAGFACLLLVVDPLFRFHMVHPYQDISQTLWIYFTLLMANKPTKKTIGFVVVGIALTALSKSFITGSVLVGVIGIWIWVYYRSLIRYLLAWLPLGGLIYLAGYAEYLKDHSLIDLGREHIAMVRHFRSHVPEYPKFEVFRIIGMGKWRRWFGDFGFAEVEHWNLAWPVGFLVSLVCSGIWWIKKHPQWSLYAIWSLIYLIIISLNLVFPRYLLPLLPFWYLCIAVVGGQIVSAIKQKRLQ